MAPRNTTTTTTTIILRIRAVSKIVSRVLPPREKQHNTPKTPPQLFTADFLRNVPEEGANTKRNWWLWKQLVEAFPQGASVGAFSSTSSTAVKKISMGKFVRGCGCVVFHHPCGIFYHPCDTVCYIITRVIRCVVLSPV